MLPIVFAQRALFVWVQTWPAKIVYVKYHTSSTEQSREDVVSVKPNEVKPDNKTILQQEIIKAVYNIWT